MKYNLCKVFVLIFGMLLKFFTGVSQDTILIKGKVVSVDTMKYYYVIKIKTCDNPSMNKVLLSTREDSIEKNVKAREIVLNKVYVFHVNRISIFRGDDGQNIILNLREYSYSDKFTLHSGELPYSIIERFDPND